MPTGLSEERLAITMVVLQPCFSSSGLVEVFLGTADSSILAVDVNGPHDQLIHGRLPAPVTSMAIAPNGRFRFSWGHFRSWAPKWAPNSRFRVSWGHFPG